MPDRKVFTIDEFCERNGGFSKTTFHAMQRAGSGPRTMAVGRRRFITEKAEADWLVEREREAEAGLSRHRGEAA